MTPSVLALVIVSAMLHAAWNFLLKRLGGRQVIVGLSKVTEVVVLTPIFALGFATTIPPLGTTLWLTGVAAIGVGTTYVALGRAYRHGDLSLVYPITRGATLLVLPIAGCVALGEHISVPGVVALACISGGILLINLPSFSRSGVRALSAVLRLRATMWALLTALVTALFTIWDKRAVALMEPFAYMYLYTLFVAAGYIAWLAARHDVTSVGAAWREGRGTIVSIGVLNTASYFLVLAALRTGVTSYVLGLRQLSIAVSVALGWRYLREPMTPPRVAGVALIVAGCLLLSFSLQRS